MLVIEINFIWAGHQAHHSSEDYNFTTALRQSVFLKYTTWVSNVRQTDVVVVVVVVVIMYKITKTRMWPMPNVMVALLNIGGAVCSTPQSLARAHSSSAVQ